MYVAGIDGTRKGWVVVTLDGGLLDAFGVATIGEALARLDDASLVAIDMPIGFSTVAEPGGRQCEKVARSILGKRASSVFSSPCRTALAIVDYAAASEANKASSEHRIGLSRQSHAIFPKMREVDAALTPALQDKVFEVHPEVSFSELARDAGLPLTEGKKSLSGALQRLALLKVAGLDVGSLLPRCRSIGAAEDDIIDAAVAVWTARRRSEGTARRIPADPEVDGRGLRMEMWI